MRHHSLFLFFLLLANVQAQAQSCQSEAHRAFDFWIGEWQVSNADGSNAGENLITSEQNGCLIKESWRSASGSFTGTSLNFYHPVKKRWQQLWIDNGGGYLELHGHREANKMILRSEPSINKEGKTVVQQITWALNDDKTVQQTWQTLLDGKVDKLVFDGLYQARDDQNTQNKGRP